MKKGTHSYTRETIHFLNAARGGEGSVYVEKNLLSASTAPAERGLSHKGHWVLLKALLGEVGVRLAQAVLVPAQKSNV